MKKLLLSLVAILFAINAYALPSTISYQGVLTDVGGAVLTGNFAIRFDICTAVNGVNSVWNETHNTVSVTNGLFQVELGSITPFGSLNFSTPYWLEITIDPSGANTTLSPRVAFNANNYSFNATTATNIAGGGQGSIPYQTAAGTTSLLPKGTAGQVLTMNAGATAPEWAAASGGGGTIIQQSFTDQTVNCSVSPNAVRLNFTVTGVQVGDAVIVNCPNLTALAADPTTSNFLSINSWVSALNTVTVQFGDVGGNYNQSDLTIIITVIRP